MKALSGTLPPPSPAVAERADGTDAEQSEGGGFRDGADGWAGERKFANSKAKSPRGDGDGHGSNRAPVRPVETDAIGSAVTVHKSVACGQSKLDGLRRRYLIGGVQ